MTSPAPEPQNSPAWRRYGREGLSLWRLGLAQLLPRWWQVFLIAGIGAALVLGDRGDWDNQLLQQIRQPDNEALTQTAKSLSFWGDVIWAVILALVLFVVGVVFGCPRWRQIAWACLLAVLASTVIVNVFRPTLGRARPNNPVPNGFYGPHLSHAYHSFPSGHATSAFAPAAAIAAASPLIGVPCLLFAGSVSWSRMQLNQHHPLDIMTGAALGTLIGLCFGSAVPGAKFRMRRKRRRD
ncbi:MAG: phosphatase PAP2 family protein [Pedosphaera sp.]|nr:phosphatase PAP2 family protein [Pedosphaera sp.]